MADLLFSKNTSSTGESYYDISNKFTASVEDVVSQKIYITLKTGKGEYVNNRDFGLPVSLIMSNSRNPEIISNILANEILSVPDVLSVDVNAITTDDYERLMSVDINAKTVTSNVRLRF